VPKPLRRVEPVKPRALEPAPARRKAQRKPAVRLRRAFGDGMRVERPRIEGTIDRDVVAQIVVARSWEVRACWSSAAARGVKSPGRFDVEISLGSTGRPSAAVIEEAAIPDATLRHCIMGAVKRWRFPTPEPGHHVIITQPFILRR
jgi:hypothetical protein